MIRSMEGFTFASALDLNMDYYHIKLDADDQKLCTIVFPWHIRKYKYKRFPMAIKIASEVFQNVKYKRLPMAIKIAPDVFQNVMSKLVQDMEYVKKTILS
jgi:hypothetical protein